MVKAEENIIIRLDIYLSCNGCVCKKNHPDSDYPADTMVKAEENIIIHIPNLVMTALVHCLCPAMDAFAKNLCQSRFVATN